MLDSMKLLANCWSPLTHASYCITTSWPAAVTQTRARVSHASPGIFTQDVLPAAAPLLLGLAYPEARTWHGLENWREKTPFLTTFQPVWEPGVSAGKKTTV